MSIEFPIDPELGFSDPVFCHCDDWEKEPIIVESYDELHPVYQSAIADLKERNDPILRYDLSKRICRMACPVCLWDNAFRISIGGNARGHQDWAVGYLNFKSPPRATPSPPATE